MMNRKMLAVATLFALSMFIGASQSVPAPGSPRTETTQTWHVAEQHEGPQWAYALGMEGGEALMFGIVGAIECSFFSVIGGIACGVTSAL
jgi:hypothetical protein